MRTSVTTDVLWSRANALPRSRTSEVDRLPAFRVSGTTYLRCRFKDHSATHGEVRDCTFVGCVFTQGVYVAKTRFTGVRFVDCTFDGFSFWKAYLDDVVFENCEFVSARFAKTSIGEGVSFQSCRFRGVEFALTRAKLFDFRDCSFSGLEIDLDNLDWHGDQSHSRFSPDFYLARGLPSCHHLDGSLAEAIVQFKIERGRIVDWLTSIKTGENGRYFIKHCGAFLRENIEPALRMDPLEESPPPLYKAVLTELDQRLIGMVNSRNANLDTLTPREFEELVAGLLRRMGYLARLTAATRDGGYDIFAIHQGPGGMNSSMLVECKRYAAERKVGLGIVRGLYTLRCQQEAGAALIATTSHFSDDVHRYKDKLYNLQLADRDRILSWCAQWDGR